MADTVEGVCGYTVIQCIQPQVWIQCRYKARYKAPPSGSKPRQHGSDGAMPPDPAPALGPMPTLGPTAAGTADADRAALHTTASGVPNEHVSRLRQ